MLSLYLVRHGETDLNKSGVYYGRTDCKLSLTGVNQINKLKESLINEKFDLIITSPLKRCVQTTEIITSAQYTLEPGLVELDFGLWEGLSYQEVSLRYPELWEKWIADWRNSSPPEGESFTQMYDRVKIALENILKTHKEKKILLVSHKGCLQIITSILLEKDDSLFWNFTFENGKYSLFEISDKRHCVVKKINAL